MCGEPAEHQITGIDLCSVHFRALEQWSAESHLPELHARAAELRAAACDLRAAERDYEGAVSEDREYWHRVRAATSVVYYLRRVSDGMIKIGTTTVFGSRYAQHRRAHGALQVLHICAGTRDDEWLAHNKFKAYRIGPTEWFRPGRPLLEWICRAREAYRYTDINHPDVVSVKDLRKLARSAPRKKDLRWEGEVLVWPPEAPSLQPFPGHSVLSPGFPREDDHEKSMSSMEQNAPCASIYAECPENDRQCVQGGQRGHRGVLHYNRAGFAWDDNEAEASTARVAAGSKPIPYPHRRNDCLACRERDADVQVLGEEYEDRRKRPLLLCQACLGAHVSVRAHQTRLPGQPVTVSVKVAPGRLMDAGLA